jgi:hypothetical protein
MPSDNGTGPVSLELGNFLSYGGQEFFLMFSSHGVMQSQSVGVMSDRCLHGVRMHQEGGRTRVLVQTKVMVQE